MMISCKSQQQYQMKVHHNRPYDQDIEHLKSLITKLGSNKQDTTLPRNQFNEDLQEKNRELMLKVDSLTRENKELIRQLLVQREENTQLKSTIAAYNDSLALSRTERITASPETIERLSPSYELNECQLIRPQQSSPSRLVSFSETSSMNRDQLYRLNSYLIEYNTNIKLLVEKYNYLLKLRSLKCSSDPEEIKVLNQSNTIFSNKKQIEEAKSILRSSRKNYFDSESSSEIQEEYNRIEESP